jgi:heterodisulfide reductase subunit D
LKLEKENSKLRLCLDCGKCTTFCPVAACNPDFNPRRIIQQSLNPNSAGVQNSLIWSCLECGTCQQFCNYNVEFPRFITGMRQQLVQKGESVHCSHGGAIQSAMHLMAQSNTNQKRLDWLPQDIKLTPKSETGFFVGCAPYLDVFFQDLGVKTLEGVTGALRLLNQAGIPFNLIENERCCGRDLLLQGDEAGFLALAQANSAEFKRQGFKRLITYCPECYVCLKNEYPSALSSQGIEVLNLVELLAPLAAEKKLILHKLSKRLTYHDPCTLGRGSGIYDQPRDLLESMSGVNLVEMEDNRERSLCCGASPWAYCNSVNRQIQNQRLSQAQATQADMLVTACPKCQIHLKCAQKSAECQVPQIPVVDFATLLSGSFNVL